jgi:hypothetical protein
MTEETKEKEVQTITIAGKTYVSSELSMQVQGAIAIFNMWNEDLRKNRLEVGKCEAALKQLLSEIQENIEKDGTPEITKAE